MHKLQVLCSCFPVARQIFYLLHHINWVETNVSRRTIVVFVFKDQLQRLDVISAERNTKHLDDFQTYPIIFLVFLLDRRKQLIPSTDLINGWIRIRRNVLHETKHLRRTPPFLFTSAFHNWILIYYYIFHDLSLDKFCKDVLLKTRLTKSFTSYPKQSLFFRLCPNTKK